MSAEELRELADWPAADDYAAQDRYRAAAYLRACAHALDAGPVAWTLQETLDKRETTHRAYLWFVDPQNSAWAALYPVAIPASLRLPEPMTDEEIMELYRAVPKGYLSRDGHAGIRVARAAEAETLRRVKEANE